MAIRTLTIPEVQLYCLTYLGDYILTLPEVKQNNWANVILANNLPCNSAAVMLGILNEKLGLHLALPRQNPWELLS